MKICEKLSLCNYRTICILNSYFFTCLNSLISSFFVERNSSVFYCLISLGFVMLLMVPVSLFDTRKEMNGKLYSLICVIMCFIISLYFSFVFSLRLLAVFFVEVVVCLIVVLVIYHFKKR